LPDYSAEDKDGLAVLVEMQIFLSRVGKIGYESSDSMTVGERTRALDVCRKINEDEQRQSAQYENSHPGVSGVASMG